MPLSWNEIRNRAATFTKDWTNAHYEKGQTQTFYNEFFEVFGRRRRDVAVYEEKVKKLNDKHGFIDLFWSGKLLVEQKSAGRNLQDARTQATDYFLQLKEEEKPRYILLSDFQTFELLDLEKGKEYAFPLEGLPEKVRLFDFVAGYQQQEYKDQDPVNIKASELMSNLHLQLEHSGYTGTDLERLLVRIMFCLFADDTGIFEPDSFLRYIEDRTSEDGSDLGSRLSHLFEVLDTPEGKRQSTLDEMLASFPYVNGQLFADLIRTPSFNRSMREALLKCCYFDWSKASPALFGSLFQTVMLPEEQRKGGAHYTSERNILKTIKPLFLDELREEFNRIKASKGTQRNSRLKQFHEKLGTLTFLDPACGCGNFLILAYRELRLLEIEVLETLNPDRQQALDVAHLSVIDVDQFYGIEIEEFPVRVAEATMWLMDHQMNMQLSDAFGQVFVRLPLKKSAKIVHENALTLDWREVIPPEKLSYMLGNPPFVGKKEQSVQQKNEMKNVFHGVKGIGVLDYVTAWYWKAADYIQNTNIRVAFVSTNSITQGEQVGILWQALLNQFGIRIHFAHRTFKWTIDEKKAKGMDIAAVYVVIIGFAAGDAEKKYLFEYETITSDPSKISTSNINPYLVDAPNIVITKRREPLSDVPIIREGSALIDKRYFVLTEQEANDLTKKYPETRELVRTFFHGDGFINNEPRYCLWLKEANPKLLRSIPFIYERINAVKKFRESSERDATKKLASYPSIFGEIRQPNSDYIFIPKTSSENRDIIPIGFLKPEIILNNTSLYVENATLYHFGILTSLMHMEWMRYVCGRLESRYRYSNTLVYNNFPWPEKVSDKQMDDIEAKAQAVLDARAEFPGSTLADLYDPRTMPPPLLKAHQALDKAVDLAYRKQPFTSERQRIEFLFDLYQKYTAPLVSTKPKRRKRKA